MITIPGILLTAAVSLFSIILHEIAHGLAAYYFKDKTAYAAGRLTLNPVPHIDMIGSIIVPLASYALSGMLFGWAKPVPVNTHKLQGKYAVAWVSAAGVLTNAFLVLIAFAFSVFLSSHGMLTPEISQLLLAILLINLSLALFNLIPIPPFDGMAILEGLFPKLRIKARFIYNPIYMIAAIFVASFIYGEISPYVFRFVLGSL